MHPAGGSEANRTVTHAGLLVCPPPPSDSPPSQRWMPLCLCNGGCEHAPAPKTTATNATNPDRRPSFVSLAIAPERPANRSSRLGLLSCCIPGHAAARATRSIRLSRDAACSPPLGQLDGTQQSSCSPNTVIQQTASLAVTGRARPFLFLSQRQTPPAAFLGCINAMLSKTIPDLVIGSSITAAINSPTLSCRLSLGETGHLSTFSNRVNGEDTLLGSLSHSFYASFRWDFTATSTFLVRTSKASRLVLTALRERRIGKGHSVQSSIELPRILGLPDLCGDRQCTVETACGVAMVSRLGRRVFALSSLACFSQLVSISVLAGRPCSIFTPFSPHHPQVRQLELR